MKHLTDVIEKKVPLYIYSFVLKFNMLTSSQNKLSCILELPKKKFHIEIKLKNILNIISNLFRRRFIVEQILPLP